MAAYCVGFRLRSRAEVFIRSEYTMAACVVDGVYDGADPFRRFRPGCGHQHYGAGRPEEKGRKR